ncbi:dienelactone hydrolase [Paenibacillus sp. FSL H8-0548]|uniref:dienelactone hydrolase family protein n=1 Tax=Paenibacillus sp. FSL H8-0548 TaxID=1920422 RepID=UPI00096C1790|nr:alpha/beta hydrolase family protein [Paenibacillus sp. FSL H8-0548]OMF34571.1 dienelactone hydrolase [Paenibacillus sp. FSL H8-0548]
MMDVEHYLNTLIEQAAMSRTAGPVPGSEERRQELSAAFSRLIGEFPADGELQTRLLEITECEGYVREHIEIATVEGLCMSMYILVPEQQAADPVPAVIALHGHGYGNREIVGLEPDGSERVGNPGLHKNFAVSLVREGYVVAAPELIGFGGRRLAEDKGEGPGRSSCFRLAAHLLMTGRTLPGLRVRETSRVVDYLESRAGVDADRIAIMGISGGGLVAGFTAALDARIRCAVVSGYANLFEDSILARNHCLDNYIPGILQEAELPELLGLIVPRGLFLESGEMDRVFPRESAVKAFGELQSLYAAAGAPNAVLCDYFQGGHEINGAPAFAWLRSQLTADPTGTIGGET